MEAPLGPYLYVWLHSTLKKFNMDFKVKIVSFSDSNTKRTYYEIYSRKRDEKFSHVYIQKIGRICCETSKLLCPEERGL